MDMYFFEDNIAAYVEVIFPGTAGRAIFVSAGQVTRNGEIVSIDEGFVDTGTTSVKAGPGGVTIWRWDLDATAKPSAGHRITQKLSGAVPAHLSNAQAFMRLDSVAFPPGGAALLHTHQGPGIRSQREGTIRIDTMGSSNSYGPGGVWFEDGSEPVFAQADMAVPSRFIRAMVLPEALRGKSSISYVNPEDKNKPKSQSYRAFGEIGLAPER